MISINSLIPARRAGRALFAILVAGALPFLAVASPPVMHPASPLPNTAGDPTDYDSCFLCHDSYLPDSGQGSVAILGVPPRYTPGSTYTLTVEVADPAVWADEWGFMVGATDRSDNQAGSFTPVSSGMLVQSVFGKEWISQNQNGTGPGVTGSFSWDFDWTAPANGVGTVTFWAAGLSCNGSQGDNGDATYTMARTVVEDLPGAPPVSAALQPHGASPERGQNWEMYVRLTNHETTAQSVWFATRLQLPGGGTYPAGGWLGGPQQLTIQPGETESVLLVHAIPGAAPLLTADYEVLVGIPNVALYDTDTLTFSVQP